MPMISDSVRNLAASLTVMAIIIAALVLGREILIPLALATLLAFILAPIVRGLISFRMPQELSAAFVVVAATLLLLGASALFSAQMLALTADLDTYKSNLVDKTRAFTGDKEGTGLFTRAANSLESIKQAIQNDWQTAPTPARNDTEKVVVKDSSEDTSVVVTRLQSLSSPLAQVFITFFFTLFLLLQRHDLRDRVVRVFGTDNISETTSAMSDAGERLSQLFLTQAALNGGFGLFVAVALWAIGVPNALLWGFVTALMRFVPYVGSFVSALPPLLLAAAVDPGWSMLILTALVFVVGEPLMGNVVEPLVLGKRVGLSPFAMVVAASFWTLVWGPVGLLLSAPITMCIVVLGRYIPGLEFLTVLLGDEPALSPDQELYRRLLSSDPIAAADQIEEALKEGTLAEVSDRIVLPALRLAADDYRRGRLDRDQVAELRTALTGTIDLVADSLDAKPEVAAEQPRTLIVPAHGPVDATAAVFVAAIAGLATTCSAEAVAHTSGLTALSDASAETGVDAVRAVIVTTVGGIEGSQMRFVVRRAARNFPSAQIIVLDSGNRGISSEDWTGLPVEVTTDTRLADVLATLECRPRAGTRHPAGKLASVA